MKRRAIIFVLVLVLVGGFDFGALIGSHAPLRMMAWAQQEEGDNTGETTGDRGDQAPDEDEDEETGEEQEPGDTEVLEEIEEQVPPAVEESLENVELGGLNGDTPGVVEGTKPEGGEGPTPPVAEGTTPQEGEVAPPAAGGQETTTPDPSAWDKTMEGGKAVIEAVKPVYEDVKTALENPFVNALAKVAQVNAQTVYNVLKPNVKVAGIGAALGVAETGQQTVNAVNSYLQGDTGGAKDSAIAAGRSAVTTAFGVAGAAAGAACGPLAPIAMPVLSIASSMAAGMAYDQVVSWFR